MKATNNDCSGSYPNLYFKLCELMAASVIVAMLKLQLHDELSVLALQSWLKPDRQ